MELPYTATAPREVELALLLCGNALRRVQRDLRARPRCAETIYAWYMHKISFVHMTADAPTDMDGTATDGHDGEPRPLRPRRRRRRATGSTDLLSPEPTRREGGWGGVCDAVDMTRACRWVRGHREASALSSPEDQTRTTPRRGYRDAAAADNDDEDDATTTDVEEEEDTTTRGSTEAGTRVLMECVAQCVHHGDDGLAQRVVSMLCEQLPTTTPVRQRGATRHPNDAVAHASCRGDDEDEEEEEEEEMLHNRPRADQHSHPAPPPFFPHYPSTTGRPVVEVVTVARLFDARFIDTEAMMALGSVTRSFRVWMNVAWACASFEQQGRLAAAATRWVRVLHRVRDALARADAAVVWSMLREEEGEGEEAAAAVSYRGGGCPRLGGIVPDGRHHPFCAAPRRPPPPHPFTPPRRQRPSCTFVSAAAVSWWHSAVAALGGDVWPSGDVVAAATAAAAASASSSSSSSSRRVHPVPLGLTCGTLLYVPYYLALGALRPARQCAEAAILLSHPLPPSSCGGVLCLAHHSLFLVHLMRGAAAAAADSLTVALQMAQERRGGGAAVAVCWMSVVQLLLFFPAVVNSALREGVMARAAAGWPPPREEETTEKDDDDDDAVDGDAAETATHAANEATGRPSSSSFCHGRRDGHAALVDTEGDGGRAGADTRRTHPSQTDRPPDMAHRHGEEEEEQEEESDGACRAHGDGATVRDAPHASAAPGAADRRTTTTTVMVAQSIVQTVQHALWLAEADSGVCSSSSSSSSLPPVTGYRWLALTDSLRRETMRIVGSMYGMRCSPCYLNDGALARALAPVRREAAVTATWPEVPPAWALLTEMIRHTAHTALACEEGLLPPVSMWRARRRGGVAKDEEEEEEMEMEMGRRRGNDGDETDCGVGEKDRSTRVRTARNQTCRTNTNRCTGTDSGGGGGGSPPARAIGGGTCQRMYNGLTVLYDFALAVGRHYGAVGSRALERDSFFRGVRDYLVACWLRRMGYVQAAYELVCDVVAMLYDVAGEPNSLHESIAHEEESSSSTEAEWEDTPCGGGGGGGKGRATLSYVWPPDHLLLLSYTQYRRAEWALYLGYVTEVAWIHRHLNALSARHCFTVGVLTARLVAALAQQQRSNSAAQVSALRRLRRECRRIGYVSLARRAAVELAEAYARCARWTDAWHLLCALGQSGEYADRCTGYVLLRFCVGLALLKQKQQQQQEEEQPQPPQQNESRYSCQDTRVKCNRRRSPPSAERMARGDGVSAPCQAQSVRCRARRVRADMARFVRGGAAVFAQRGLLHRDVTGVLRVLHEQSCGREGDAWPLDSLPELLCVHSSVEHAYRMCVEACGGMEETEQMDDKDDDDTHDEGTHDDDADGPIGETMPLCVGALAATLAHRQRDRACLSRLRYGTTLSMCRVIFDGSLTTHVAS